MDSALNNVQWLIYYKIKPKVSNISVDEPQFSSSGYFCQGREGDEPRWTL